MKTTFTERFIKSLRISLEKTRNDLVSSIEKERPSEEISKSDAGTDATPLEELIWRGGPGSGHYGHSGRPGLVGGSEPGGLAVGRGEAPDADTHFKWSGKGQFTRSREPHVQLQIKSGTPSHKLFSVSGAVDARGRQKPGKYTIRVNGKSIELDHDEVHSLRSKMRYMQMIEDKNVKTMAGKEIVRGNTLSVSVGEKGVDIPINAQSMRMIEHAGKTLRREGYSFTLEDDKTILKAVERMKKGENPISIMKDMKLSKAGQMATLHFFSHLELGVDKTPALIDARVKEKAAYMSQGGKFYVRQAAKMAKKELGTGDERFDELSGTQAMKHWKRACSLARTAGK